MLQLFQVFGPPKALLTDNGTEFQGVTETLMKKLGTQIRHGRPHHPQTTGKVPKISSCACELIINLLVCIIMYI